MGLFGGDKKNQAVVAVNAARPIANANRGGLSFLAVW